MLTRRQFAVAAAALVGLVVSGRFDAAADVISPPAQTLDGALDLGIVRDSKLVATNDFQIFTEMFESAAFVGSEPIWVRVDA